MKLAEFRYGKEEMLALFDEARPEEKDPPDEYSFLKQFNLWITKPQIPLNLQESVGNCIANDTSAFVTHSLRASMYHIFS
jgi:hypothetical protein